MSNAEELERDNNNEGNGDELGEEDIDEDGNGGKEGDEGWNGGKGGEECDEEGNEERNIDKVGIGYEGGNNEEGSNSPDDIYKDNAVKKLAMEGDGGEEGNGNGDDPEGNGCHLAVHDNDQMVAKVPTVPAMKTPGTALAKKPGGWWRRN